MGRAQRNPSATASGLDGFRKELNRSYNPFLRGLNQCQLAVDHQQNAIQFMATA
jgi:hypothetical protein